MNIVATILGAVFVLFADHSRLCVGSDRRVPPVRIRPGRIGDEAGVQVVDRHAETDLRKIYRPTADAFRRRADLDRRLQRLVATLDETVVGTVQYYILDGSLALLGLAVHTDYRRRGVARALLTALETIGRSRGLSRLTLHTIRQTGNVDVFRALGYTVEHEEATTLFEPTGSVGTLIEVRMSKSLD